MLRGPREGGDDLAANEGDMCVTLREDYSYASTEKDAVTAEST